ncbi:NAD(P)-binding protein [Penicillium malachiteum]|uniref:NAD(P)-binding protein n=1 Tax=Penicillium malachiteum TaxID=1324776 RepID=UPI002546E428|nr:NAD(P)-binding protein [Penicillium malachiteum]KAJ5725934.1 NAD(P)-binding protein [Penicillium malachiteum]
MTQFNLNDQTIWFVTGCSSGLGKSFAQIIYKAGHRIIATARNVASLSYLPDDPNVLKLQLDVTSQEAIISAFAEALQKFPENKRRHKQRGIRSDGRHGSHV